ncbi:MAG: DNA topoisomerase I, partial [Bacteroidetes bacterium]|nr:DNA topoisomerase I [Bacteroidota bacterium]
QSLELFKLPKNIGTFEDKDMTVAIGKFGPYIRHNGAFYSLPKDVDPLDVSEEQAIGIIADKRKRDSERVIKTFAEAPDVKVLNGRFGPYIEFGKQNVKIPKGKDPQALTYEECKTLAEAEAKAPKKANGKRFVKKK